MASSTKAADAARLREFRTRKGWSQERAAAWWGGITARTWRRWESPTNPTPVPPALLKRITAK